jgi:surface antigen Omp85-like protein
VGWVYTSHFRASVGALYHRQWIGRETLLVPPPVLYNTREGNIVTVQLAMIYDSTSAPEGLRRGTAITLKNELSDSFWKSDFDYFKIDFLVELYGYFHKTYPSAVLHSEFVYPTSDRGVPVTEIVRTGGAALRGYLVNEFHGDTLVTIQLEEAMPLFKFWKLNFAGAIFADAGALLERHPGGVASGELTQAPTPSLKDFHTGAGAGLRILIPGISIPALKLDLAYGFDVSDVALIFSVARGAL